MAAINQSNVTVNFDPLVQSWDLSKLAQLVGVDYLGSRVSLLPPVLVFTIDLPEIFVCSVAAIIRTYLQTNYR